MKNRILCLIILAFITSFAACSASYEKLMKDSETEFYKGNYINAAKKLLPYVNKEDNNQLVFMMECGLMLHAAGEYEKSNTILLGAAKLADTIATSVSKEAAALLLNETKTNYKGEDFERVLIHMYLGINFLMLKNADSARVSFKKVNDLLRDINVSGGKNYKQNLMAKYLTAIAFELSAAVNKDENDREFAYIEYKQIHELDPKLELVHNDLQRVALQLGDQDDYKKWAGRFGVKQRVPKNSGELILFYQAGKGAVKASRGKLLDDGRMKGSIHLSLQSMPLKTGVSVAAVLFALKTVENPMPVFKKRSNKIKQLVVNIDGKDAGTIMLENIEDTAVRNMEEQYTRMYVKVGSGIAVKAAASVAAGLAAKKIAEQSKKVGQFAGVIGLIAGVGTGAALTSQIQPDLRCWRTLPANLQIGRLFLNPGTYNISVKFINQNGAVEQTKENKVEIKKGEKIFLNYRTLY